MPFSKQTLDFLVENRLRDSRDWFHEHNAEYQRFVREPLLALAEQLAPVAEQIDPQLITEPRRCISRINRDTRFTKDKSFYREVMWCAFSRPKDAFFCPPGLVFELSPNGFRYGCGYWCAPPKTMEAIRTLILEDDPAFRKALRAYQKQTTFQMEGDYYKRAKFPEHPQRLRDWLERKNIDFLHNSVDFNLLYSDRLGEVVADGFRTLKPIYAFLCAAEERLHRAEG